MERGLMEKRNGLLVDACLKEAGGYPERAAALTTIEPFTERTQATLGAEKAYDAKDFIKDVRSIKVTPHVAQNIEGRRSASRPVSAGPSQPCVSGSSSPILPLEF